MYKLWIRKILTFKWKIFQREFKIFLHRIENFPTLELKISNLDLDTLL